MQEREKNKAAMKSLVLCSQLLTWHRIAHSTNFTQLVDLVVSCGTRKLQVFVKNASWNAVYNSRGAVVDFIEVLGTWVEESLKRLKRHQFLVLWQMSALISRLKELVVFCLWEDDRIPVECIKDKKNLQVGNIIGMNGF